MHFLIESNRAGGPAKLFLPRPMGVVLTMLAFFLVALLVAWLTLREGLAEETLSRTGEKTMGVVESVSSYRSRGKTRYRAAFRYTTPRGELRATDNDLVAPVQTGQEVPVVYLESEPSTAHIALSRYNSGSWTALVIFLAFFIPSSIFGGIGLRNLLQERALNARGQRVTGRVLSTKERKVKSSRVVHVAYEFPWNGASVQGRADYQADPAALRVPEDGAEITVLAMDARLHRPL